MMTQLSRFYASSIGKKAVVAVTGAGLLAFVFAHMTGNLLIYLGPDAINAYGRFLHELGHGTAIWFARLGLLAMFGLHIVATVQLTRQNRAARPRGYALDGCQRTTSAARFMIVSGLTVLAFVIYHLMHFTLGVGNDYRTAEEYFTMLDGERVHNIHQMVVDGFSVWPVSVFYILAMFLLCWHLMHGFSSVFQTLGAQTHGTRRIVRYAGYGFAAVILIGNTSIPLAVLFGLVS